MVLSAFDIPSVLRSQTDGARTAITKILSLVKVGQKVGQAKCKVTLIVIHSVPRPAELRNTMKRWHPASDPLTCANEVTLFTCPNPAAH